MLTASFMSMQTLAIIFSFNCFFKSATNYNFLTLVLYSITSVILPVIKTIFGASGCFPVSQGQEIKDLTASSGHKAMRGCQCSFSAQVWPKNSHE